MLLRFFPFLPLAMLCPGIANAQTHLGQQYAMGPASLLDIQGTKGVENTFAALTGAEGARGTSGGYAPAPRADEVTPGGIRQALQTGYNRAAAAEAPQAAGRVAGPGAPATTPQAADQTPYMLRFPSGMRPQGAQAQPGQVAPPPAAAQTAAPSTWNRDAYVRSYNQHQQEAMQMFPDNRNYQQSRYIANAVAKDQAAAVRADAAAAANAYKMTSSTRTIESTASSPPHGEPLAHISKRLALLSKSSVVRAPTSKMHKPRQRKPFGLASPVLLAALWAMPRN
jgi:hypothetical protein